MRFENNDLKTTFELPDEPTGRVVLRYDSITEIRTAGDMYERLWSAALGVMQNWQSETLPDMRADVLGEMGPGFDKRLAVVKWAGLTVFSWRQDLNRLLEERIKNA